MNDYIINLPLASLRMLELVGFPRPELVAVVTTILRYNFSRSSFVLECVSMISLMRGIVRSLIFARFSLMMSCRVAKLVSKYTCICIVAREGEYSSDSFCTQTSTNNWTSSLASGRSEMKPCSGFRTINLICNDKSVEVYIANWNNDFPYYVHVA